MDKLVTRIFRTIGTGLGFILELVWGLIGLLGISAVGYGWSMNGNLGKGIEFFIQEFQRFFSDNTGSPLLQGLGNLFTQYVNMVSGYPWVHSAVLLIGLILIIKGHNRKRFVSSMRELIATAKESPNTATILRGTVVKGSSSPAIARANRKIGFEQRDVVETTGMPQVLARHANWGLKKKS